MRLARRVLDPFAPFALATDFDRAFDRLLGESGFVRPERAFPAINLWEDADKLFVEAELPGYKLEDIELTVVGDELTLKGRRATPESAGSFLRQERLHGEFLRALELPFEIDSERVEATLKDGVLLITLPKAEAARARKISVRQG